MKKSAVLIFLLLLGFSLVAQDGSDIFGDWLTQDNDSKVTFTKDTNDVLCGQVTWVEDIHTNCGELLLDVNNPDESLRGKTILGLTLLNGFVYNPSKNRWVNGNIYDPTSGKTYKCQMWVQDDPNKLSVRGYIGISLLGREVVWTREKKE